MRGAAPADLLSSGRPAAPIRAEHARLCNPGTLTDADDGGGLGVRRHSIRALPLQFQDARNLQTPPDKARSQKAPISNPHLAFAPILLGTAASAERLRRTALSARIVIKGQDENHPNLPKGESDVTHIDHWGGAGPHRRGHLGTHQGPGAGTGRLSPWSVLGELRPAVPDHSGAKGVMGVNVTARMAEARVSKGSDVVLPTLNWAASKSRDDALRPNHDRRAAHPKFYPSAGVTSVA
jgi:hypothetical protein